MLSKNTRLSVTSLSAAEYEQNPSSPTLLLTIRGVGYKLRA